MDACHNLRVALDSQQPALNIGVPIENLRLNLLKQSNKDAIKNEFNQRPNGEAAKYLCTVRQELSNLQREIDGKLSKNNYPGDTKAVLKGTCDYIKDIITILSPTKVEGMKQFVHEVGNNVKDGVQKVGNFLGNVGKMINEKLPKDEKIEKQMNKLIKNAEEGINNLGKKVQQVRNKVKNNINNLFDS